ncbi:hypothetical protein U1Q18_008589 [Sarracenia purpurea var. burkii]
MAISETGQSFGWKLHFFVWNKMPNAPSDGLLIWSLVSQWITHIMPHMLGAKNDSPTLHFHLRQRGRVLVEMDYLSYVLGPLHSARGTILRDLEL